MGDAAESLAMVARELGEFAFVVSPEARGFILGPMLAREIDAGFIPVRKPDKLPPPVQRHEYELEYGLDSLEIQEHGLEGAGPVLIYDDVLATGGTANATARLVEKLGGTPSGFAFLLELAVLGGRAVLEDNWSLPVGAAIID